MQIINRTPHDIVIDPRGGKRITLSADPANLARVESSALACTPLGGVPICSMRWGDIIGLPSPRKGVFHVVSVVVAAAACCNGRGASDLLVPGEQVRDPAGRIIGARSLAWAESSLPGLADA